ncbi:hypothetical protein [Brevibacterium album]|uniref:hypothetical protein n=1 Tax=Brevibacterium album TaxID=417948 RepID=UPI0003FA0CF4|nr:hypothetical protein [Brevibacterium album]
MTPALSRRTVAKGAAWSVPVIGAAVAAPLAAASVQAPLEGIVVEGRCAGLGLLGRHFRVTASADPIPAGSVLTVRKEQGVGLSLIDWNLEGFGGLLSVSVIDSNTVAYTFADDWSGRGTLGSAVNVDLAVRLYATLELPSGYEAGETSKLAGSIRNTLVVCRDD